MKRTMIAFCVSLLLICSQYITVHAAAPNTVNKNQAEAEAFVRDYYETFTEENLAALPEKIDNSPDINDLHRYMAECKAMFECGLQEYDNIVTTAYPLSDENFQIVMTQCDMLFEGIDIGLPSLIGGLVHKQDDGSWRIVTPYFSYSDFSLSNEILQIARSDELVSMKTEADRQLYDILQKNPSIALWLADMSDKLDKLTDQYLQDDFDSFMNTYIKKASEQEISNTYIVQKGDCLWDIAENVFGDGMRWTELYENNKDTIGSNPDLILIGLQLQLY